MANRYFGLLAGIFTLSAAGTLFAADLDAPAAPFYSRESIRKTPELFQENAEGPARVKEERERTHTAGENSFPRGKHCGASLSGAVIAGCRNRHTEECHWARRRHAHVT